MAKKIKVGIIGFGNIGSAVAAVLRKNRQVIADNTGIDIQIKKVCDTVKRKTNLPFTKDFKQIINDPDIDVVVEAIGGENAAKKIVLVALKAKKHVVTPNKELVAKHMEELLSVAKKNRVQILFEASVGGGIPIIQPIRASLASNRIDEVYGIVNGTTNYILTQMSDEGMQFSEALHRAKEKGYAEPDPTADIEGYDAAYKAAILASVTFKAKVNWKEVSCEGITRISKDDIDYAKGIGYVIKLLAIAKLEKGKLDVRVHPALVSCEHPLASVSKNYNAIYVKGYSVGDIMFHGQGAGGEPTAASIISDIISCGNPKSKIQNPKLKKIKIKKIDEISSRYYVRLQVADQPGVLAAISKIFGQKKVSIDAVSQRERVGSYATLVILLHKVAEKNLKAALKSIKKLAVVRRIDNVIRII